MKDVIQAAADDVTLRLDSTKRGRKHQDMWNTYLQKSYLKLGRSWLGACVQLLCSVDVSKVKSGEKLHMHMVEILVSHSR